MDKPLVAEPELIAPRWFRWLGVVLCALAALVVGLTAHGDQLTAGLLLAGSAALV